MHLQNYFVKTTCQHASTTCSALFWHNARNGSVESYRLRAELRLKTYQTARSQVPDPKCQIPGSRSQTRTRDPGSSPRFKSNVPSPKSQFSSPKYQVLLPGHQSQLTQTSRSKCHFLTQLCRHPFHCITRDGRGLEFGFRHFRAS